ncbi:MAG TPA: hypothetical protein PLF81_08900 [Candidatus Anammoximicrobium sp.]|nr:hypothetical protein [Candidatus Anammoximicrobium sp.]
MATSFVKPWSRLLPFLQLAISAAVTTTAVGGEPRRAPLQLADKTLVAWVCLADTAQRGGSAVTLMEGEDFDAIVFGERAPGRWMAGSDFFRRTQGEREQQDNSAETADAKTLVQIAAVWSGDRVAIYRNGQLYASYRIDKPRTFGSDTAVLLGLRYLGGMGAIGFLRGAIDEARIYDWALEPETIAALRPNVPSDPPPLAQWTFEDGTATDTKGTFPPGQLVGEARIADGRLWLNGADAYVVCEVPRRENQIMFYAPLRRETGTMWDTWLYHHAGAYYLFYLARTGRSWDNISMATSADGVHWQERGVILRKADGVTWMGTGSTWRSPNFEQDGKYQLNFSEWRGDRQTIFFAESKDLLSWKRLGPEYEFQQDVRWYKPQGRWDCIYTIPRPDGGLFGYWTADPEGRPGVGFGRSLDGVHWEALEPPQFVDGAPHGEAGAVERIGQKCYLLLGSGGMKTLVADRPHGPFRPARKNFTLLHGGPTYFARFFPTNPDGLLINHHAIAKNGRIHLSLLKRAMTDDELTLRLGWWSGNERLKHEPIAIRLPADVPDDAALVMLDGEFPTDDGMIVEGVVPIPADADSQGTGVYIETAEAHGTAILVRAGGVTEFGLMQADGTGFKSELRADREMPFGSAARFRLALKGWLLEFYLDDILMECYSLPSRATGRIGLSGGAGRDSELRAWR